jgi:hypothetical protein
LNCIQKSQIIKPPTKRKKNGVITNQKNDRTTENARYLSKNLAELQKSFIEQVRDDFNISNYDLPCRATFYNHRKRLFKQAKRRSDMCDYCVLGNTLKKNLEEFIKVHFNELYIENFDLAYYLREFSRTLPPNEIPAHLLVDLNQQYVDEILNKEPDAEIPFIEKIDDNQFNQIEKNETRSLETSENKETELNIDMDEDDSDDADDDQ